MNRVFLPAASSAFKKSLLLAVIAFSGASALAADAAHAANPVPKIDPAKGGSLYDSGDNARGLPACVSCHGAGRQLDHRRQSQAGGTGPDLHCTSSWSTSPRRAAASR
jgi:mono/diheme cytochrome c family protein